MFVLEKHAESLIEPSAGACNYRVKIFADEDQLLKWVEEDAAEFEKFLKEKSNPEYKRIADDVGDGGWYPEKDNPKDRTVWFSDLGEEDMPKEPLTDDDMFLVPFLKKRAKVVTILSYTWYFVDHSRELLERDIGIMPKHVCDDPSW